MSKLPAEWQAFVAAAADAPADDLVRLAFADWLDEQGEAGWAELIRVQCALEPVRGAYLSPELARVVALERREAELLKANAAAVLARFGCARDHATHRIDFARGMPERLRMTCGGFLSDGAAIRRTLPTLRRLALTELQYGISGLSNCRHFAGFERLDLCDYFELWRYAELWRAAHIGALRTVSVWAAPNLVRPAGWPPHPWSWPGDSPRELRLIDLHGDPDGMAADGPHNRAIDEVAARLAAEADGYTVAVERPCTRPGYVGDGWPRAFGEGRPAVTRPFTERTRRGTLSVSWLPRPSWEFVDNFGRASRRRSGVADRVVIPGQLEAPRLHFAAG